MRNPAVRKVALRTVGMASLALQADDQEAAESDLAAAERIIGSTQERTPEMTAAKTPANPVVTADSIAAMIAAAVAQALAAQAPAAPQAAPAPAATPKPISKNAIPEASAGSVKSIGCDAAVLRATASTVVYAVANHNVLWADRGVSIDRMALQKLGNPATIRITITAA
jgi:hypothetical protein